MRRRGRRAHARARPQEAAGCDERHPPALHARRGRPQAPAQWRALPARHRAHLGHLPRAPARRGAGRGEPLRLLAGRDSLRISRGTGARGRDPGDPPAQAHLRGPRRALSAGRASRGGADRRARAAAGGGDGLRAFLPHGARHRALRAQRVDPLPGAWLRRQFRDLLLPRHHRGGPGPHVGAVRTLHLQGEERAARHRRGFRARR